MLDRVPKYEVIQAVEASEELYQACLRLVPQLTNRRPLPTRQQLAVLLASPASYLYIARHTDFDNEIIGLATLVVYHVPTGIRGYIEDVVVDERVRGLGIDRALTVACLQQAERMGTPQVMLTCNPGRKAANQLYQRMGFELRKTNVYRYSFSRK